MPENVRIPENTPMKGCRAIVTGGGTGLGAATALGLARAGASVCINYATSTEAAEKVAADCRGLGVDAFAVRADVSEDEQCKTLVTEAAMRMGGLDVLVNNAGTTKFVPHADMDGLTPDDLMRLYKVNVVSMYQMIRAARPHLEAGYGGSIVNVSSFAGVTGMGSSVAYAATKGAINTMTLSLARALAPKIRVNGVCPGYIASGWYTRHTGAAAEAARAEEIRRSTPLKVVSAPEDIAEIVLFFAGPASRHVTGEFILVDGGTHLGH
jgi:NAD(P)-dependent dehydrogenase (short-subunit alcohol dehydrogenase family)